MADCYFDTSVFLAILNGEPSAVSIRALLRELKRDKLKIYTSIITVQEVAVQAFRGGGRADALCAEISKLARIQTITREVALTAARLEAELIQKMKPADLTVEEKIGQNRRRKWDCFHIATALELHCQRLYSMDDKMLNRKTHLDLPLIDFLSPRPRTTDLFPDDTKSGLIQ
ncbi:MAG TPA: type II toxin-antitoxin system VapC family toxin [Acidobacteriaceae bacterium]|nr:type II toxin-antitoxin system VapC family toxin [Acidobacteriaceae bacterium]